MLNPTPLSGGQVLIHGTGYEAVISTVGASLRSLTYEGRNLVTPFDANEVRPRFRGAILAPWPNRIVDGTYTFDSIQHQLAITEPQRGHALHGLVLWLNFEVIAQTAQSVTLKGIIEPQQGYPHRIALEVHYLITNRGLSTSVTATNLSEQDAPYGLGPHPYLVAGPGPVDDWSLQTTAKSYFETTGARLLPDKQVPIQSGDLFDFSEGKKVGDIFIDHAFTELLFENGLGSLDLTCPTGTGVRMTWGPQLPWLQLHTADVPGDIHSRNSLAVEPMTCPPDAFNSGIDLIVLRAGEKHFADWHISALS